MNDEHITAEATPAGELRRQILSQCVAKNEREWWAARTIEKLEFELNAANDRIKRLEAALSELLMWLGEDISDSNRQLLEDHCRKAKEVKP